MERVWASEFKYDIFLVSLIHDSIYLIMRDNIRVVEWVNKALIEEMSWQSYLKFNTLKLNLAQNWTCFT